MNTAMPAIAELLLFLALAPLVVGTKEWIASRLQLYPPAPPWQPWLDLLKLIRRPAGSAPEPSSWVFAAAPPIVFGCYLMLGLALPPFGLPAVVTLDLITIAFLLSLGRFLLALAGMDSGTPYGGISASRTMFVNVVAEPILILVILGLSQPAVASATVTTNVGSLLSTCAPAARGAGASVGPAVVLGPMLTIVFVLMMLLLLENGLLPFDSPNSHLEVPMIEEGMRLPYSGRSLALLKSADAMRLTFFLILLAGLVIRGTPPNNLCVMSGALPLSLSAPHSLLTTLGLPIQWVWFGLKLLIAMALLAIFEVSRTRAALVRLSVYGLTGLLLALAAVVVQIVTMRGGQ